MKKLLLIGAVAAFSIFTTFAQTDPLNPCPDCLPCTNCVFGTNVFTPVEYPLDTLLIREVQIANGTNAFYLGPAWIVDTNNLLMAVGGGWIATPTDTNWTYTLGVTNTNPDRVYTIEFSPTLGPSTSWLRVLGPFYGSTNNSELTFQVTVGQATFQAGFFRVTQQDGFVLYAMAGTNGFIGGGGSCPGTYHGYINYVRYATNGWGYLPDTNVVNHWATDLAEPTNHLELVTDYGYVDCNTNTVKWTNIPSLTPPLYGTAARFSIFFLHYPTNQAYPVWLRGFIEPTNAFTIPSPHIAGVPGTSRKTVEVQPFAELDDIQMKAMGLTTNDLMTHPVP